MATRKKKAVKAKPSEDVAKLKERIDELEAKLAGQDKAADTEIVERLEDAMAKIAERDGLISELKGKVEVDRDRFRELAAQHPDWIPEEEVGVSVAEVENRMRGLLSDVVEGSKFYENANNRARALLAEIRRLGIRR